MLWMPFRGTKIEAISRNSIRLLTMTAFEVWTNHFVKLFWLFFKTNIFCVFLFHSEIRNWLFRWPECLGMSTFFCGITETVLNLLRGIFSVQNTIANRAEPAGLHVDGNRQFVGINSMLSMCLQWFSEIKSPIYLRFLAYFFHWCEYLCPNLRLGNV